jgi:hypothetical protein
MGRLGAIIATAALLAACHDASTPSSGWADACHAASRRHMDCGASVVEAGKAERICREGGACVERVLRADAIDPLMECMQSSCEENCAQRIEDALEPLDAELEVLAASQSRSECKLAYDVGPFGRLVSEEVWTALGKCWEKKYCLDIQECIKDVQHEQLSACAEPLTLVVRARPMPRRRGSVAAGGGALGCRRMCSHIERSCRASCRPQSWSPNMRSIQSACERDCDFARFSCESDCKGH